MNIPLISGQIAKLHVKLETEDDFELYGGTTKAGFSITSERPGTKNEWLVTIDEPEVAGKPLTRFDIYVRQLSSEREWVVLSGKLLVSPRSAGVDADKLAPIEYNVTIPVVENAVDLTGAAIVTGIPGPRGYSAYEIAVMEGFEGTEAEWLEYMRLKTATLAVKQVTPLMERAEAAANEAEAAKAEAEMQAENAETYMHTASTNAEKAKEHQTAAAGEVIKAAAEVQKAAAEVDKAKQEKQTASEHAAAAAKSAQDALANQQAAEQAAQDAALAQVAATAAKAQAQTAEGNAKASANAAAADKAAAAKSAQDAQAAQTKAEQEATRAEGYAGQLGDAALQGADNAFSGANTFNGTVAYNRNKAVPANELAFDHIAAMDYMVEFFDWTKTKYFLEGNSNISFPANMPTPKSLQAVTNGDKISFRKIKTETLPAWVFNSMTTCDAIFQNSKIKTFSNVNMFPVLSIAAVPGGVGPFYGMPELEEIPEAFSFDQLIAGSHFASACPKLRRAHGLNLVSLREGHNFMTNAQLDKQTVLAIFSTIRTQKYEKYNGRTPTGDLHLGIHVDYKNDEEVQAAIAMGSAPIADGGKNWNVIVQWNGTSTAATFALRPSQPLPVYAKVETYQRDDGTEWRSLSWCHEVFTPDGKEPEELGYELFDSVEDARAWFNLPEPVEEETETNE